MKPADKTQLVKWMRQHAKVLHKDIEEWPEGYEIDTCAFILEWAAEIIVKYAPNEIPPKK